MTVVRFKRTRRRLSIRYYLCTDRGPVRVPARLHRDLLARLVALPAFTNTFQRVLEAVITERPGGHRSVDIRPTTWRFDHVGKIDLQYAAEGVAIAIEGEAPKLLDKNVLDIGPSVRARRRRAEMQWQPGSTDLRLVRADIASTKKLPIWHPSLGA